MWEFEIMFVDTGETDIIHGYNIQDACNRCGIDINTIEVLFSEYID